MEPRGSFCGLRDFGSARKEAACETVIGRQGVPIEFFNSFPAFVECLFGL